MSHPSRAALARFFAGGATPEERAVAQHLLPDCSVCSEVIASWGATEADDDPGAGAVAARDEARYGELIDRVLGEARRLETVVAAERDEASRLLPRLLRQPLERQLILVGNSRQYQTAALCDLLLEAGFGERHNDPPAAEVLARVAVAVAAQLDRGRYSEALVNDFQGRAWAHLANARRVLGDFQGTEEALGVARSLLAAGSGSLLDDAFCCEVESSLRSTRGDHARAIECVGRAIGLYRRIGAPDLLGRALILQGMVWSKAEDFGRAVVVTRTGLRFLDPDRDSRVALAGSHNLCLALHRVGEDRQALVALARARPVYLRLGNRAGLLRFQWLEGTIAASLGRDEQAEGCLREAREGFIQLCVALEAAEVSLDLASLLYRQGRTTEVRRLAVEMIAIFESRESRQETLAAFILLRQAAERDRVSEALIRRLAASLHATPAGG